MADFNVTFNITVRVEDVEVETVREFRGYYGSERAYEEVTNVDDEALVEKALDWFLDQSDMRDILKENVEDIVEQ